MSSQRGNVKKGGAQKHKNKTAFKNNLHDSSKQLQHLNSMTLSGICARCKDVIAWKIKYRKYKPLSKPSTCTLCKQKTIKRAYYTVCEACAKREEICAKCGKKEEIISEPGLSEAEEAVQRSRLQQELRMLPERKRRTFLRLNESGARTADDASGTTANGGCDYDEDSGDDENNTSSGEEQDINVSDKIKGISLKETQEKHTETESTSLKLQMDSGVEKTANS